ncbi:MAG: GGDEF domain-containing protein [Actinomycetota bacterium]|nr:MAG: GGDEF domain-containing protein [Actinomycetota bacterium]
MEYMTDPVAHSKLLDQIIGQFIELFNEHLKANRAMQELMETSSSLEHHDALIRNHLNRIYSEGDTIDAFELSHKVGRSHINHGVRPSWYLTTYNKIFQAYHSVQKDGAENMPDLEEFRRIWLRDAGDTSDSYHELLIQQHTKESRLLQKSILELDIQARTDPLTEILNRRGFRSEMDRTGGSGLFLLLDLDNFKSVNDLYGHVAGDEVLKKVATGLTSELRKGDLVARIGGDEFSLWLPAPAEMTTDEIRNAVKRILSNIPFSAWNIGISGGLVHRPSPADSFDDLYAKADLALYEAKLNGRFTLCLFETKEILDINPRHWKSGRPEI